MSAIHQLSPQSGGFHTATDCSREIISTVPQTRSKLIWQILQSLKRLRPRLVDIKRPLAVIMLTPFGMFQISTQQGIPLVQLLIYQIGFKR